ncbi:MAG: mechanosensitive ion channel family protein [Cyanobacteriota bacterium]|nr:mechanosensitive ion channel family protein [Cyanobacteriota bacterium]
MPELSTLIQAIALIALLVAARLACKRLHLAPIPLGLPILAILISTVHPSLASSLSMESAQPWLKTLLHLGRGYAALQLGFWLLLELPGPISWWPHPPKILRDLSALGLGALLTLVVLQQAAKVNVVGLVTTSAILTAVIGLAAQEALKDLFAGIMLRLDCPFVEGDYLELDDELNGWVDSLTLLSTKLRHVHGALITLPNSMMWQKHMRRFSPRGPIARELHIHLDRELPPGQATELLLQVAEQSSLVLKNPKPEAIVYAYHDYAITYELEVWQEDPTDLGYDELRGELLSRIWYALERIGQRVPYPIQEFKRRHGASGPEDQRDYDLEERMAILRRSSLFGHLIEEQLAALAARTRCVRFALGELIVVEQEHGDTLYQIVNGRVAVLKTLEGGETREVVRLEAPAFFGEMSVFNDEPRTATVQALEPCVLLEVDRNDLRPLLEENPAIMVRLAEIISQRRAELLKLTPENTAKQGNELLNHMRRLFLGS